MRNASHNLPNFAWMAPSVPRDAAWSPGWAATDRRSGGGFRVLNPPYMLAVIFAMSLSGCSDVPVSQPNAPGLSEPDQTSMANSDLQSADAINSSGQGYVSGRLELLDQDGQVSAAADFVFISTREYLFFQWRPLPGPSTWAFELFSQEESEIVYGDLDDTLTLVDSRQPPSRGLPSYSWVAKFDSLLRRHRVNEWPTRLHSTSNDAFNIAVRESGAMPPEYYAKVDWNDIHQSAKIAYRHMLERTIDK